jgi:hypothetical protein
MFPPPAEFQAHAAVKSMAEYEALYQASIDDPEAFWAAQGRELISWMKPFDKVLDWQPPHAKWFVGGTTNAGLQLPRPARRGAARTTQQGRAHLRGRARRHARATPTRELLRRGVQASPTRSPSWAWVWATASASTWAMIPEAVIAMLACARLGAAHTVMFGGFSADSLRDRLNDAGAKVVHHAWTRRGAAAQRVHAQGRQVDAARALVPSVSARGGGEAHRPSPWFSVHARATCGGTTRWPGSLTQARGARARRRAPAVHPLHVGHHREAQGRAAHDGRLHGGRLRSPPSTSSICKRRGRVLVHRRRGLGDGPQLRGVRPALQRRHGDDVRGRAQPARPRPLLGHHRAPQASASLHGAHRHPCLHQVGRRAPAAPRPEHAAPAGHGGRAHQPRGLDVVPRGDRRRALPDRGHVVADRDGRHHDDAAARRRGHQAGLVLRCPSSACVPKVLRDNGTRRPPTRVALGHRAPWPSMLRTVWGDDARFQDTYFSRFEGKYLLHGRRRAPRRARLLLGDGPRRRRGERGRAIAWARPRSRARWSRTRPWPRPPWWAAPTISRGRRWWRS